METVSQSENGQERVYQGNVLIPCWKKVFYPGSTIEINIRLTVKSV
ncbi:MAG: alpha-amylase/4-alpha-glucanotransferase domain-containing protein [Candidatus Hydrogenedens sp.]